MPSDAANARCKTIYALDSLSDGLQIDLSTSAISGPQTQDELQAQADRLNQAKQINASPDGSHVAYLMSTDDRTAQLLVKRFGIPGPSPGVQVQLLAPISQDVGTVLAIHWSPDGKRLAYIGQADGQVIIGVADQSGRVVHDQTIGTADSIANVGLVWSADGGAFGYWWQTQDTIYVGVADAHGNSTDAQSIGNGQGPALFWSPDNRWLAYLFIVNNTQVSVGILSHTSFRLRTQMTLPHNAQGFSSASWAADGQYLDVRTVQTVDGNASDAISILSIPDLRLIFQTEPQSDQTITPVWSAIGHRLAYLLSSTDSAELHVLTPDAPPGQNLAYFPLAGSAIDREVPLWSPNGRYAAVFSYVQVNNPEQQYRLDVLDTKTLSLQHASVSIGDVSIYTNMPYLRWAADSSRLLFAQAVSADFGMNFTLAFFKPGNGQVQTISSGLHGVTEFGDSYLLYRELNSSGSSAVILNVDSGAHFTIDNLRGLDPYQSLDVESWSAATGWLTFADWLPSGNDAAQSLDLWMVNVYTHATRRFAVGDVNPFMTETTGEYVMPVTFAPDRKHLAFLTLNQGDGKSFVLTVIAPERGIIQQRDLNTAM